MPRGENLSPVSCPPADLMRVPGAVTHVSYGLGRVVGGLTVSIAREVLPVALWGVVLPVPLGLWPGVPACKGQWCLRAFYPTPPLIPGIRRYVAP